MIELGLEVDGACFTLRVHDDPSGLRGEVFWGDEKVTGSVQVYHTKDPARLVAAAARDPAVRGFAARLRA